MAETITIRIEGMNCDHCVRSIESGLREIDGVVEAKVNFKENSALLTLKESSPRLLTAITAKVEDLGYEVKK